MKDKKIRDIFIPRAISADFIAESINKHSTKNEIGAHSIFLGQIRADSVDNRSVAAIEYTAYEEMANQKMFLIREEVIEKYNLTCMHVYHSLGRVETGGISLFVFTSAPHRIEAIHACEETVERIKKELPVWGREILSDDSYHWKKNSG
jgi:molybdopterin synthase catalytic subunit